MHKTVGEATALAKELVTALAKETCRIMIAPPFTALLEVSKIVKGTNIVLGAQNMAQEVQGAHTGEVSPVMLKDVGVTIVILGHSERRHVYGEKDELINKKVKLALSEGLEVILCVGEKIEERNAGNAEKVVEEQIKNGLKDISPQHMKNITIAYEPVWAIGTGVTATPEDADDMHAFIRKTITALYSPEIAETLIIQYGGSVKPNNAKELMAKANIDGALVGGAALTADQFVPIVQYDK